jgi:bifunctional non-homologous end joining protein LigD
MKGAEKEPQEKYELQLNGHTITLSNLQKVYWPDEGYTKGDLINYYQSVSAYILPYLKDRPQSMHRHPNGLKDEGFYHKHAGDTAPDWVQTVEIFSPSSQRNVNYLLCQNAVSLAYMNNLGCIEIHPWNSRVGSITKPDYLAIDLDPGENTYDEVVETALIVKQIMDKAGATCYCKTSGATGMHIFVPLSARYDFEKAENFARKVAELAHAQLPELTSLERSPKARRKRIYLDYLQNNIGQTLAAAYSVRPKPGATVSTPLQWSEVKKGLHPMQFTIKTVPNRLQQQGDLFSGILEKGVDLDVCLDKLTS